MGGSVSAGSTKSFVLQWMGTVVVGYVERLFGRV